MIKQVAVAVALSLTLAPMAQGQVSSSQNGVLNQNVSDLWWVPTESGWGIQLNQMAGTVFATLYVYNQSGQPTWYTAELTAQGNGVYSGPVIQSNGTAGTYFGATSFDAGQVTRTTVGTMTLSMQTNGTAFLSYTVNGVSVNKTIQRQTLVNNDITGTFQVQGNITASNCTSASNNGTSIGTSTVSVVNTGDANSAARQITWTFPNGSTCIYTGNQAQGGRFSSLSGATYTCSTGETGTLDFSGLSSSNGMFSGSLSGTQNSNGCSYTCGFSGLSTTFGQ